MDILCYSVDISVADPDFQIREARSFRPCDSGGGHKKKFWALRGSFCSKNKGGPPPPPQAPALDSPLHLTLFIKQTFVKH